MEMDSGFAHPLPSPDTGTLGNENLLPNLQGLTIRLIVVWYYGQIFFDVIEYGAFNFFQGGECFERKRGADIR